MGHTFCSSGGGGGGFSVQLGLTPPKEFELCDAEGSQCLVWSANTCVPVANMGAIHL